MIVSFRNIDKYDLPTPTPEQVTDTLNRVFVPLIVTVDRLRCETCAYWTRGVIPVIKRPSCGGVCANPELRAFDEHQAIETAEDFGCVQWEENSALAGARATG